MKDYFSCIECDYFGSLKGLKRGKRSLKCPRCHHRISPRREKSNDFYLSLIATTLLLVGLSFFDNFLSFTSGGSSRSISILDIPLALAEYEFYGVGGIVFIFVVLLPILFLLALSILILNSQKRFLEHIPRHLGKFVTYARHWVMMEVFFAGVLVALVKIVGMVELSFETSFWSFLLATLIFSYLVSDIKTHQIWTWVLSPYDYMTPEVPEGKLESGEFLCCHICHSINEEESGRCQVCHSKIYKREPLFIQKVLSLVLTACLLYIPANVFPIMVTSTLGKKTASTIMEGIVLFFNDGSIFVALVIFFASIFIPLAKISIILWLCYQLAYFNKRNHRRMIRLYRLTEFIGKWSMVDIFVVAILAALIQMKGLIIIEPGLATQSFSGVVILTMLAAMKIDTRTFWDQGSIKGSYK